MKISITVKAKSRKNEIKKVNNDLYVVAVNEAPEKGRANEAVIKLLSEYFHISPSKIMIVSGTTSKHKIIEITEKVA